MALTPEDILNHEFEKRGRGGYSAAEVNEFLDTVNADYRTMVDENAKLKQRIDELESTASQIDQMKESVNNSIIVAQEAADKLRRETEAAARQEISSAHQTAEKVIGDAHIKGDAIVSDMARLNAEITVEQSDLRKKVSEFRKTMERYYKNELKLIQDDSKWQQAIQQLDNVPIKTNQISIENPKDIDIELPEKTPVERVDAFAENANKNIELPKVKSVEEIKAEVEAQSHSQKPTVDENGKTVVVFPKKEEENNS
jgi:cell division initiation protein